jgi:hypothetical protein
VYTGADRLDRGTSRLDKEHVDTDGADERDWDSEYRIAYVCSSASVAF